MLPSAALRPPSRTKRIKSPAGPRKANAAFRRPCGHRRVDGPECFSSTSISPTKAAAYRDGLKGKLADIGVTISELSTHFQGQMVSAHPAFDAMFGGQRQADLRGDPERRRHWAAEQVRKAALVSRRLGLTEHVTFTGSLAWPYFYPYPQRPAGLVAPAARPMARVRRRGL
jgi:sugar phosphate isomerase/epimerase